MDIILPIILLIAASPAFSIPHDASLPRPLVKSEGVGGDGGTEFDDMEEFSSSNIIGIHSINISSRFLEDSTIYSIGVVYVLSNKSLLTVPSRGRPSNDFSIVFKPEEQIVKVEGKVDSDTIGQLTITTVGPDYKHTIYGPFGDHGMLSFAFEGQIIAFHGRSSDYELNQIGVYSLAKLTRSQQYSAKGLSYNDQFGNEFDDISDLNYPPIVAIKSISIWISLERGAAIQMGYLLLDGSTLLGKQHGHIPTTNFNTTTIMLEDGDKLMALQGEIDLVNIQYWYISQLNFTIMTRNGMTMHGPFGNRGIEPFYFRGNILGIYGSSDSDYIYRIGAYYL